MYVCKSLFKHGERERHLLSNHADIEHTISNAIEHFLYVECFRDEQKLCLNLVRRGQELFRDSSNGFWGELDFSTLSTNNERNQRKTWRVNFHDHHRCASPTHMKYQAQAIWNISSDSHRLGGGGMGEDTAMWKEDVKSFMEAQKAKKTNLV